MKKNNMKKREKKDRLIFKHDKEREREGGRETERGRERERGREGERERERTPYIFVANLVMILFLHGLYLFEKMFEPILPS